MMKIVVLSCVAAVVVVGDVVDDAKKKFDEVSTIKDGTPYCPPNPITGVKCPSGSWVHYYECCGGIIPTECCWKLMPWVNVTLIVLGVVFLASIVGSIIRCLFCRRR